MSHQLVTRVHDDLASSVDELVAEGVFESRSDAVRTALQTLVDQHRRRRIAEEIIQAYEAHPQTEQDVAWADEATLRMIAEEPW